jgi:1-acyl-sn-glycerol-3-phosphate acyltransferase
MLYPILRSFIKLGLNWYVSDWQLKNLQYADHNNPAVIVSNHPNSFFDALIITVHQPSEICFLTRGDIFEKPWANWVLRTFFMLPIYKKNDGDDAEISNAFTYDECVRQLKMGRKLLIFPEGVSRNHIDLKPFMTTGLNSIIQRAVQMDVPIQVQPYILSYNSFDFNPKAVYLEALESIDSTDYLINSEVMTNEIIKKVRGEMDNHMLNSFVGETEGIRKSREWMRFPAIAGKYTHNWYYQLVKKQVLKKTDNTIFYDSLLFAILLFTYPVIIFLLSVIIGSITGFWWGLLIFILLPFLSYCWVQYQPVKIGGENLDDRVNKLNP